MRLRNRIKLFGLLSVALAQISYDNFEIQLLDLKNKEMWCSKFECLCVEVLEINKRELSS